jgi:hypothetical protein
MSNKMADGSICPRKLLESNGENVIFTQYRRKIGDGPVSA